MNRQTSQRDREIGARIRQLRLSTKSAMKDLAAHLGVSMQQVQKYERGASKISAERLEQIAEFFGVKATNILDTRNSEIDAMMLQIVHYGRQIESPPLRRLLLISAKIYAGEGG